MSQPNFRALLEETNEMLACVLDMPDPRILALIASNRAALATIKQGPNNWQPIITAPRDGTEILACDYDSIQIIYYDRSDPPGFRRWMTREYQEFFPAFWQPLPEQPPFPEES